MDKKQTEPKASPADSGYQADCGNRLSRRELLGLAATAAASGVLPGCGGGGSGEGSTGGAGGNTVSSTIIASPAGPQVSQMRVTAGAISATTPSSSGAASVLLPVGRSTFVVASNGSTKTPMLLALVPSGASGSLQMGPASTVAALMFLRLGGWFLPQNQHLQFLQLIQNAQGYIAAVSAFNNAYHSDANALTNAAQNAVLVAALSATGNAVIAALTASGLAANYGGAFASKRAVSRATWASSPSGASDVNVSFKNGNSLVLQDSSGIYRWAELNTSAGSQLGAALISNSTTLTMQPSPLPNQSPLTLTVTGGLASVPKTGLGDPAHLFALGLTLLLNIVVPLFNLFTGLDELTGDLSLTGTPDAPNDSRHPLLNYLISVLVYDPKNPVASLSLPVPTLMETLAADIGNGDDGALPGAFLAWTPSLLSAIASNPTGLAQAIVAEAAANGLSIGLSAVLEVLADFFAPWLVILWDAYNIIQTLVGLFGAAEATFGLPWTTQFTVTGYGLGSAGNKWTVVNLSPAGATDSEALGIGSGQQVGWATVGGNQHASLWSGTAVSWVDLNPSGSNQSYLYGVGSNQQVGYARVGGALNAYHASLWRGTAASWVDLSPAGTTDSVALGVGDGQQVGYTEAGAYLYSHASLWRGTAASWVDLNPAGATESRAFGVFAGQQVGYANPDGFDHASLWIGTAASWVDLNPVGAAQSYAYGVGSGQQVGYAILNPSLNYHASMWSGTSASWVDLNPADATNSYAYGVYGGQQVGYAVVGGVNQAGLWSGTAASWVNLHSFLPANYSSSQANGIWNDGVHAYVVGSGVDSTTGNTEALMWVGPAP